MKRFFIYLTILSSFIGLAQEKDKQANQVKSDTLWLDDSILHQKTQNKTTDSQTIIVAQDTTKYNNFQTNNIDITGLSIDNVVLKDLPDVKRMDSLWYRELYQPELFDSINNLQIDIDQIDFKSVHLDTVNFKRQLELLNQKTQLDIVYHPALLKTIKAFIKQRKKSLGRLFGIASYYFPIFEEKLAKYNIPLEMKYLAIVESALNPRAVSRAGAGGLWQFMYSTGKYYNLEINSYVDERFDPIRETEAACKHMQDLYKVFHDWNLVLAAYNSGAGNVTKAIRRSGGYTNYWNIRPYLPRETAGYVPLFQATLFLGEYAEQYGIVAKKPTYNYIATDTIIVKHTITFNQISRLLKINEKELEFLNPQYKVNIIPYVENKFYTLKLPIDLIGIFVNNEALIYSLVENELNKKEKPLPKFYKLNNYIVYRVRKGDYLGRIARRFHTTVGKIKRTNRLRSNRLRVGQKLKIYSKYPVTVHKTNKHYNKRISNNKSYITYSVKPGDTLWNISRKYNVSLSKILKWNRLKKHTKLKPGMKLKIYIS